MQTTFDTITLGTGIADVGWPTPGSVDPARYTWDRVGIVHRDAAAGIINRTGQTLDNVAFPAELHGQSGTLVAICDEPREMRAIDTAIRQNAPVYPAGTEVELGRGPVVLRRLMLGNTSTRYDNTAISAGQMDAAALRSITFQPVTLEFRPDRRCGGFATCQGLVAYDAEHCTACREDGWGNECTNCGAPGGGSGPHGYCGSCHDAGLCHVCHPDG